MRRILAALFAIAISVSGRGLAADLTAIDRSIGKLPQFSAPEQEYCLLVFGPEAARRIWVVRDGDVLYVDRNGNGDLTEPGERVNAHATSKPDVGSYYFQVGDIPDEPRDHKDLRVYWISIDHLRDTFPDVRALLDRKPNFRACRIDLDVAIAGQRGSGIDGRVSQMIWDDGFMELASRPQDAPIVHFGGPWQLVGGTKTMHVGRSSEVDLAVGTPGLGAGATACVGYEGVIPPQIMPRVQMTFPPAQPGQESLTKTYELMRRCCTINLYGDVAVPENVGTGTARMEIVLDGWPGGFVAPLVREVSIVAAKPGPKLQPVSSRLKSKLEHQRPGTSIYGIHYSPDGKRIIAGDYPGGVVHVWDVASGKRLVTIETGDGFRGSAEYFAVSPDWQTLYAPHEAKGKFERLEKDGKTINRVTYDGSVQVWDLSTGTLTKTLQHSPPRNVRSLKLSPDGKHFLTREEVPGEFENSRPQVTSWWDTDTFAHRDLADGNSHVGPLSADGRLAATSVGESFDAERTIKLFTLPEWNEVRAIATGTSAFTSTFAAQGTVLVGGTRSFEKPGDWQHFKDTIKLWNVASGEELLSIPCAEKDEASAFFIASPDAQTVAALTYDRVNFSKGRLLLIDPASRAFKTVTFGEGSPIRQPAFHPSGKWLAVVVQAFPPELRRTLNPPRELATQPRIVLVDLASAAIMETLVAPPTFGMSMAFSPDGKTLATSGQGEVLLWDFSDSPLAMAEKASH